MKKFIPVLLLTLLFASQFITARAQATPQPVVHAVMLWQAGCPHCEETLEQTLPPLQEKYGAQFDLLLVEVASVDDIKMLYEIGAAYGLTREETGVPMLILGDQVLVGSEQVRDQLPALIEEHLAQGGVDWPPNPILKDFLPTGAPAPLVESPILVDAAPEKPKNDGFTLAIGIMVCMAAALLYSLFAFAQGQSFSLPAWGDWLIPVLIVIGIGVAGYLSYIETQPVEPFCGPIGDCKSVQHSKYAILFNVLPVGIFGLLGYLGLLAAWLARRFTPWLEKPAAVAFWGMAFFAVVFSLYLTYLEPFVIHAVCIWCLSSAVLATLLLLLGLPPVVRLFSLPGDME
jgi:uncharacterized membrane protein